MVKYILKRWYVVVIFAMLASVALYVEKATIPTVPQSGAMRFNAIVKVEGINSTKEYYVNERNTIKDVTIIPLIQTWGNEQKFIDATLKKYDYLKFNKNWNSITKQAEKFEWINRHFITKYLGNDVYEFSLVFTSDDVKDYQYVYEYGASFINDYIAYVQDTIEVVYPDARCNVIENHEFVDTTQNINTDTLSRKYAIIGFVLGGVAGIAVLCVLYLKRNNG